MDLELDLDLTCRICLKNCASNDIYTNSKRLQQKSCKDMMSTIFSFEPTPEDGMPSKICSACNNRLISAYELKILAEKSYRKLLDIAEKVKSEDDRDDYNGELLFDDFQEEFSLPKPLKEEIKEENKEDSPSESQQLADEDIPLISLKSLLDNDKQIKMKQDPSDAQISDSSEPPVKKKRGPRGPRAPKAPKAPKGPKPKAPPREPVMCEQCGKLVTDIYLHRQIHTKGIIYPCGDCPKTFTNYSGRRQHRDVHHLGKTYFCPICQKTVKRGADHRRMMHSTRPKNVECPMCKKCFFTAPEMQRHFAIHTQERPHPCSVCQRGFRTKTMADYHRRSVHEKERTAECKLCDRKFFNKTELRKHTKRHFNEEKKHMCNQCGKRFLIPSRLKAHEVTHSDVRNFVCQVCNSAFKTNCTLNAHMLSHTKRKTHPCKYCGIMFGRNNHRTTHERNVHERKALNAAKQKADAVQ